MNRYTYRLTKFGYRIKIVSLGFIFKFFTKLLKLGIFVIYFVERNTEEKNRFENENKNVFEGYK